LLSVRQIASELICLVTKVKLLKEFVHARSSSLAAGQWAKQAAPLLKELRCQAQVLAYRKLKEQIGSPTAHREAETAKAHRG